MAAKKNKMKIGESFDVELDMDASVGNFPEGIHRARCVEATVEENKKKDGHNLVLTFEAIDGEYAGRRIRNWLTFKEAARWKLTEALHAFGAEFSYTKEGKPRARLTPNLFVGKIVRLHVANEDYMGEERPQIQRILEPRPEDVETDKKRKKGKKAAAPKPEPEPEPEDDTEEDEEDETDVEDEDEDETPEEDEDEDEEDEEDEDEDEDDTAEEELPF